MTFTNYSNSYKSPVSHGRFPGLQKTRCFGRRQPARMVPQRRAAAELRGGGRGAVCAGQGAQRGDDGSMLKTIGKP